jgi:flavin-dependent dehydrogenase
VLDPALRSAARAHGVKIIDSCVVAGIERTNEGWLLTSDDDKSQISARLLVAADGRQSRIAKQLENPTELKPNDRAAVFGYFFGIAQPSQQRSVFILHEGEMAFIYPLPHGKTLLSVYIKKDRARQWHNAESIELELLRYIGSLPGAPEIGNASIQSPVSGYMDYPNQIREPVHRSVAFIGDAALSLDPMSGVGCGFALTGAQLLADAFKNCELSDSKIEEALRNFDLGYRKTITPHASGICADSLTGKDTDAQKRAYQAISTNIELSKAYLALTGRLLLPVDFQRAFLRSSLARPTVFS